MFLQKMVTQSRLCKSIPLVTVGSVLVIVGVFYLVSWFSVRPESERGTPVRFGPLDAAGGAAVTQLAVVPTLGSSDPRRKSDEAYVALQYGGFFVSLRVLGQSLRESGTTRDMVALCMPDVPKGHREILRKEGWIVKSLDPLPKSCVGSHVYSRHFAKVQAWLLTEYRRVVLIDSDAIVLRNIDALFNCGEFCAAYRHSDLFNTGVVVLKPSVDTFRNICSKVQLIRSFTNGDQGFLNYFYEDLKKAPMFLHTSSLVVDENQKFQRLPAEYNGDVSIFYLTNQWMYLDTAEPYVLHYTLGPIKPWKWWSYPLFTLNWRWKSLRDRLPPTELWEPSLWDWNSWFPLVVLLVFTLSAKIWLGPYTSFVAKNSSVRCVATVNHYILKIVPTLLLLLACYWAFSFVPETMDPVEGWTRYGLWALLFFSLPFCVYCHLAYVAGAQSAGMNGGSPSAVRPLRIVCEALLWLTTGVAIFYLQFWVPVAQTTTKRRAVAFFGLGFLNLVLCYWCGRRLVRLCHSLGSSHYSP